MECPKCCKSVSFVCTDVKICLHFRVDRIKMELREMKWRKITLEQELKEIEEALEYESKREAR